MNLVKNTLLVAAVATLFGACTVGEETETPIETDGAVTYLDTDGDGVFDAVDSDFDGIADYYFDAESAEALGEVHPVAWCSAPLVDVNGDGQADGLDWNCDGVIDIWLTRQSTGGTSGGTSGGGSTSQCKSSIYQNGVKHVIDCSGGTCTCTEGSQSHTCQGSNCSQPGNGNCCGF